MRKNDMTQQEQAGGPAREVKIAAEGTCSQDGLNSGERAREEAEEDAWAKRRGGLADSAAQAGAQRAGFEDAEE